MLRLSEDFNNIMEMVVMGWPVSFNASVVKKLDKSWAGYPVLVSIAQASCAALHEEALLTGTIQPSSIRSAGESVLGHGGSHYPVNEWSKILYRVENTLQNLVTATEQCLTLKEVDLIEARFELSYFNEISAYVIKMGLAADYGGALSLAARVSAAGAGGTECVVSMINELADAAAPEDLANALNQAGKYDAGWISEGKISFWKNDGAARTSINYLRDLLSGSYGWTTLSLRFVDGRLRSDIRKVSGTGVNTMLYLEELSDNEKCRLVGDAYSAHPPQDQLPAYRTLLQVLLPEQILDKKPTEALRDIVSCAAPEWLVEAVTLNVDGLAHNNPTIHSCIYQILYSEKSLGEIVISERFYQGFSSFTYCLADEFRDRFNYHEYIDWDYAGNHIVFPAGDMSSALIDSFNLSLKHIVFSKSDTSEKGFNEFLTRSDVEDFFILAGAIISKAGRQSELVDVLVESFPASFQLICSFAEIMMVPKKDLLLHPVLRDSFFSADLGL